MADILSPGTLKELADRVVRRCRPNAVEGIVAAGRVGLTRFNDNAISQNVVETSLGLSLRLLTGQRTARVSLNQTDDGAIDRAIADARAILGAQRDSSDLLPLPRPQRFRDVAGLHRETAALLPAARADAVTRACREIKSGKMDGAGIFETAYRHAAIFNSEGLRGHCRQTSATMSVTARTADGGAGWAETLSHDASRIEPERLAATAAAKARASRKPRSLPAGAYDVILEPAAVAELVSFLAYLGFGALAYIEGRGPLAGRLGQKVFSPSLTVEDDAFHPAAQGLPFDFEGIPRQKVRLVDEGVFCRVVHDRVTARRLGVTSTGHSLPQPNTEGPLPLSIVVGGGDATLADLVASTRRGILVTQLHYTNVLDPGRLVVTGMTRNGTFLVERGKVTAPVKNLRLTEGLLDAFSRIDGVGREQVVSSAFLGGSAVVPALRIRNFHFTSATEF